MGTTLTGTGITWFRWMALRSAVELEGKGIRGRRSMTAQANRKAELEALTGTQLAAMPVARVRALEREWVKITRHITRLEGLTR